MKDIKTIYEQLGGTYREENGSLVPDMELPEQKQIGKYGRMHLDYLKQHRRGRYSVLLGEGRLNAYLADIDEQAHEMLSSLTVELAKTQGIDEQLKETDQMRWVQMMNNVRAQAEEIVLKELVFACQEERKAIDELLSELQKGEDSAKAEGYIDLPTVEKSL
ncbi:MAG: TnpV protein [Clostridia bacterium]|nr:TnpV protein [Clostridia bacterium]